MRRVLTIGPHSARPMAGAARLLAAVIGIVFLMGLTTAAWAYFTAQGSGTGPGTVGR